MARSAVAPDGTRWRVRRLWLPRLRWKPDLDKLDGGHGSVFAGGSDDLAGAVLGLLVVVVIFVLGVFVLPYLVLVLELLVLPLVLLYKIAFRHPFTVQATSDRGDRRRWQVEGWGASGDAVEHAVRAFAEGREPMLYRA